MLIKHGGEPLLRQFEVARSSVDAYNTIRYKREISKQLWCFMDKYIGHTWGKRTVLRLAQITNGPERMYLCRCECGSEDIVGVYTINAGRMSQCSKCRIAYTNKANTKHGMSRNRTHKIWEGIIRRCNNSWDKDYERYGKRGIKIDGKWLDFDAFLKDMGEAPKGTSIDRINGLGNYEPGNCRWATLKEQLENRNFSDLSGQIFSSWTVVQLVRIEGKKGRHYKCRCACGNEGIVDASSLRAGRSTQCSECMYKNRAYLGRRGRTPKVT